MFFLFIKFYSAVKLYHQTIYARTEKTRLARVINDFLMFSFFTADNRRQNLNSRTSTPVHHRVYNLICRLLMYLTSALRTVRRTNTREQQAIIIIYFGHCTNSRTGIFMGCFLFYRNSRRQSFYIINIRLIHTPQKLPRI